MNTIVVGGGSTPNASMAGGQYGNSESRGLIQTGNGTTPMSGMAGVNDEDFDDTQKRKKMVISDAIEQADGGKKPGKKLKKKRKNAKNNNADNHMLNMVQAEDDDDNNSWDSSRAHAKHIDLGASNNLMGANDGNDFINRSKPKQGGGGLGMPEYYNVGGNGGTMGNASN